MMLNALTLLVASVPSYFKQAAGEKEKCWKPEPSEQHTASKLLWITVTLQSRNSELSRVRESYRRLRIIGENMPQTLSKIFFCDYEWRTSVWQKPGRTAYCPTKKWAVKKSPTMYEKRFCKQLWKVKTQQKNLKTCNWNTGPNGFWIMRKKPKNPTNQNKNQLSGNLYERSPFSR